MTTPVNPLDVIADLINPRVGAGGRDWASDQPLINLAPDAAADLLMSWLQRDCLPVRQSTDDLHALLCVLRQHAHNGSAAATREAGRALTRFVTDGPEEWRARLRIWRLGSYQKGYVCPLTLDLRLTQLFGPPWDNYPDLEDQPVFFHDPRYPLRPRRALGDYYDDDAIGDPPKGILEDELFDLLLFVAERGDTSIEWDTLATMVQYMRLCFSGEDPRQGPFFDALLSPASVFSVGETEYRKMREKGALAAVGATVAAAGALPTTKNEKKRTPKNFPTSPRVESTEEGQNPLEINGREANNKESPMARIAGNNPDNNDNGDTEGAVPRYRVTTVGKSTPEAMKKAGVAGMKHGASYALGREVLEIAKKVIGARLPLGIDNLPEPLQVFIACSAIRSLAHNMEIPSRENVLAAAEHGMEGASTILFAQVDLGGLFEKVGHLGARVLSKVPTKGPIED